MTAVASEKGLAKLIEMPKGWYKPSKMLKMSLFEAGTNDRKNVPKITILSDNGIPMGPFTTCKDYLDDFVWALKTDATAYECCGWIYTKGQPVPSLEKSFPIAVQFEKGSKHAPNMVEYLTNLRRLFYNLEKELGIPAASRTTFAHLEDETIVLFVSLAWLRCVATCSFVCYLSRAGMCVENGDIRKLVGTKMLLDRDVYYAQSGQKFINQLLEKGFESFKDDWSKYKTASSVHSFGFVAYSR